MTDEGSCIRLRSLICALKGAQRDDIEQMKEVITGIIPQVSLYFVQAYELWLALTLLSPIWLRNLKNPWKKGLSTLWKFVEIPPITFL